MRNKIQTLKKKIRWNNYNKSMSKTQKLWREKILSENDAAACFPSCCSLNVKKKFQFALLLYSYNFSSFIAGLFLITKTVKIFLSKWTPIYANTTQTTSIKKKKILENEQNIRNCNSGNGNKCTQECKSSRKGLVYVYSRFY